MVETASPKDRPILFSGPLVRALLAGRKTVTRRLVKPQPPAWVDELGYTAFTPARHISGRGTLPGVGPAEKFFRCPFSPGMRLWVRETWGMAIRAGESIHSERVAHYRADGVNLPRWKPSIFMPRAISRITLEVTAVRAERLQDITEADAQAEGLANAGEFAGLWDAINGKRQGCGWAENPWVFVVKFKVPGGSSGTP